MYFYINQVSPIAANAGITNTQNIYSPTTSSFSQTNATAAAAALDNAVGTPATTGWLGLDVTTWLTVLSIGLYIYFSLQEKH